MSLKDKVIAGLVGQHWGSDGCLMDVFVSFVQEELAEGLHLIDFEQLKIENQTYNEKIEERNEVSGTSSSR